MRIGIDYDRASLCDGARHHVGVEESQELSHVSQRTQYLRRVYYFDVVVQKFVVTVREVSTRTELWYLR